MESKYDLLVGKLDRFIRKYYKNQLLRGFLLGVLMLLCYFLLISYSEYLAYFSVEVRTSLVILGSVLMVYVLVFLIVYPLLRLLSMGDRLSYKDASQIISRHFPELEDRLLNTIELAEKIEGGDDKNDLLIASINQRIESIRIIPFGQAVSFGANFKYAVVLTLIVVAALLVWWYNPTVYSSSAERLVHFRQKYSPPAPFSFIVVSDSLEVEKGGDYGLKVEIRGDYVPAQVYCCYGGSRFRMKPGKNNLFSYLFRTVNNAVPFYLEADEIRSANYRLDVISLPSVLDFNLRVVPPPYTGLPVVEEHNMGDLSIPQGSHVSWNFVSQDVDSLWIKFDTDSTSVSGEKIGNSFFCEAHPQNSTEYGIHLKNNRFDDRELVKYRMSVVVDQYPTIRVVALPDSARASVLYFKGILKDDYGFSDLYFKYRESENSPIRIPITINRNQKGQEFYFAFDFSNLDVEQEAAIHYYFEVRDNDAINGPKSARSQERSFLRPSPKQLYDMSQQIQDSLTHKVEESRLLSRSLQKDLLKLQQSFIQNPGDEWRKQQLIKEIDGKRKRLESLIEQIRKENIQKNNLINSMSEQDSMLLKKQEQIEELLSKVMDDELKKLLEEFEKLSQEGDPQKMNKLGDKLKFSFRDLEKQMDRNLELLKRYEMEGLFRELANRAEQLSSSQKKSSSNHNSDLEHSINEHRKDSLGFEQIKYDYLKLLDKNKMLKQPIPMDDMESDFQEIENSMQQTGQMLQNNRLGKARSNQKETARQLKKLASRIDNMISQAMQAQMIADSHSLMRLLNNLVEFSFEQEDLIYELREIQYRDPRFQELAQSQMRQKEKYSLVRDSLIELSSKSPQIASAMGSRIFEIEKKLDEVMEVFPERQKHRVLVIQQEIMTQVNDLALLLSEVLRNINRQMAQAMPGQQMGEGKGQGKPSLNGLRQQQQSLKQQLQQIIKEMKEGKGKDGGMSQKMARMLKQHEMYKKSLRELMENGHTGASGDRILRQVLKMLEQTEVEIANFSINSNTLSRQNRILTRLLEAENAQRQKDWDSKRESRQGNNVKLSNPKEIFEYKRIQIDFNDNFYNSNVKLFDYYSKLYLDYMIKLDND